MRGFLRLQRFAHDPPELLVFDATKLRFTHARKNFGDRKAGHIRNSLVEIDVLPSELARHQSCGGRLAAAHKSREADEPARTNFADHSVESAIFA